MIGYTQSRSLKRRPGGFTSAYRRTSRGGRRVRGRRRGPPAIRGAQRGFVRVGGFYGRYANGGELKFFDTTVASTSTLVAGAVISPSLVLIPQGVTESERVGRKCTIKAMYIQGQIISKNTTTVTDADDTVKILIFLDKQANGAAAAVTDLLETATVNSFNNLSNSSRFKTLKVVRMSLRATAATATSTFNQQYDFACAVKLNLPIEYSGVTGAIGEIRSNNIGILVISQDAKSNVQWTVRVRFSDG